MPPLQYSLDKAREEGRQEGHQEGIQKGLLKGEQEGMRIGRLIGVRIGEVAIKMLQSGIDIQTISKCTGISKTDLLKYFKIKKLKK